MIAKSSILQSYRLACRVGGVLQLVGGHGVETLHHGHAGGHQLLQLLSLALAVRRTL